MGDLDHEEPPTTSGSGGEMQYPPDVKYAFEELCPVCGDKVSGYHYGLLTCESCKGFFKRTVQNKKVYSCVDNRNCHIDKSQRKRCPYCRFQKCLSVGMKLEAVRQDRMRGGRNKFGPMYKRDRALKQQAIRQQQQLLATCHARFSGGMNMMGDQDIKPDPSMLHQLSSEGNVGYAMHSPPLSSMPSPGMPDSPPQDLSRLSNSVSSQALPTSTNSPSQVYSMPPNYHHSVVSAMRNQYSATPHMNHHYNHHSPNQMSPLSPVAPPIVPIVPQLILDVKASMADENEIKQKLTSFVQNEFGHEDILQPSVLINMLCKLSDQLLFLMVEWARTSFFFKDLKVEDQMKLLQNCWSEILILDLVHRLVRDTWSGEVTLLNGKKLTLDCLDKLGLGAAKESIFDLVRKMKELKIDINEYLCLKFLILLNPDVPGIENRQAVENSQEKVNSALMEYCVNFYPHLKDKFGQVLLRLPEVRLISMHAEEFLYYKHLNGEIPDQTLLIEMLHSKKK
ncbi:nuclear receptor subfamily 5 group A member 2-like isoform X3 [Ostrea edulis]|uniref:nuclear receptor subfamily 5 group A member 2-like isoform X3 n=1 Tax=Ostrea edulis TaxID=37623 RepID=UPI0024AF61FE|nr:nuclear receptor subfamily 5 group A member 2-like isoform X3 [Ostrea edulis]